MLPIAARAPANSKHSEGYFFHRAAEFLNVNIPLNSNCFLEHILS